MREALETPTPGMIEAGSIAVRDTRSEPKAVIAVEVLKAMIRAAQEPGDG